MSRVGLLQPIRIRIKVKGQLKDIMADLSDGVKCKLIDSYHAVAGLEHPSRRGFNNMIATNVL